MLRNFDFVFFFNIVDTIQSTTFTSTTSSSTTPEASTESVVIVTKHETVSPSTTPEASTVSVVISTEHEITVQKKVQHEMIMRPTWGALAPRAYTNLQFPLKRVIISHTVRPQCMNFVSTLNTSVCRVRCIDKNFP